VATGFVLIILQFVVAKQLINFMGGYAVIHFFFVHLNVIASASRFI